MTRNADRTFETSVAAPRQTHRIDHRVLLAGAGLSLLVHAAALAAGLGLWGLGEPTPLPPAIAVDLIAMPAERSSGLETATIRSDTADASKRSVSPGTGAPDARQGELDATSRPSADRVVAARDRHERTPPVGQAPSPETLTGTEALTGTGALTKTGTVSSPERPIPRPQRKPPTPIRSAFEQRPDTEPAPQPTPAASVADRPATGSAVDPPADMREADGTETHGAALAALMGSPGPQASSSPSSGGDAGETAAAPAAGNPKPPYPMLARQRGYEGRVVLDVLVDGDGAAMSVRLRKSSGHVMLDKAALGTVKRWRFVRRTALAGQPARIEVPVRFRLIDRN